MPKPVRPPSEIIASIAEKSAAVREAATELTAHIVGFLEYLSTLKGRVETVTYGDHPDYPERPEVSLAIWFHKVGKEWELAYRSEHQEFAGDEPDWKPLVNAPLNVKMAAVRMFPDVLTSIEKSQEKLTAEILSVSREYEQFAAKLKSSAKGGL